MDNNDNIEHNNNYDNYELEVIYEKYCHLLFKLKKIRHILWSICQSYFCNILGPKVPNNHHIIHYFRPPPTDTIYQYNLYLPSTNHHHTASVSHTNFHHTQHHYIPLGLSSTQLIGRKKNLLQPKHYILLGLVS